MNNKIVPIEPVSKDLIYMKVADAIHNYIHVNNLAPGDKIPAERVMAEQLQTSRNSVREALRVLQNEGIIEVKIGKGAFITTKASSDSIYLRLFKVNYLELLEIKTLLERESIKNAVHLATPGKLEKLEESLVSLEKAAEKGIFAQDEDNRFHHCLLNMASNKMMAQMVRNLIEVLNDYAKLFDDVAPIWVSTVPYHRQMLEAIKAGNEKLACEAHNKILEIDMVVLNTIAKLQG